MGGTEQKLHAKQFELDHSWKSYEWLIKERLMKIDEMTRNMIREMQTLGVPADLIAEQLPIKFDALKQEVVAENDQRFFQGKSFHGTQRRREVPKKADAGN